MLRLVLVCSMCVFKCGGFKPSSAYTHVTGGTIVGQVEKLEDRFITSFKDVPYAWPPTGKHRFKPPQPVFGWSGVHNATNFGSICFQQPNAAIPNNLNGIVMNEDCLNLNIFIPGDHNKLNGTGISLPVLVVVHPGNFQEGSGRFVDGSRLALEYNAIVITFNFRLGIWGMMDTDSNGGNVGLRDQISVLDWVQVNIAHLGGRKDNVVILCDHFTARLHLLVQDEIVRFNRILSFDGYGFQKLRTISDLSSRKVHDLFIAECGRVDIMHCVQTLDNDKLLNISNHVLPWDGHFFPILDGNILPSGENVFIDLDNFKDVNYLLVHNEPIAIKSVDNSGRNNDKYFHELLEAIAESLYASSDRREKTIHDILRSVYFPEYTSTFATSALRIIADAYWTEAVAFADIYSTNHLTFIVISNSVLYDLRQRSYAFLQPEKCLIDKCDSDTKSQIDLMKSFIKYGFPLSNGIQPQPYSSSRRDHATLGEEIQLDNVTRWPYVRQEMLWRGLLPNVGNFVTSTTPCTCQDTSNVGYADKEWGLDEAQLDAFLLSLILISLFLLIITITLLRILCYIRRRPIVKRLVIPHNGTLSAAPSTTSGLSNSTHNSTNENSPSSPRMYQQHNRKDIFHISEHCH